MAEPLPPGSGIAGELNAGEIARIEANPDFRRLVASRASLGATLVILTMVIYFGYIFLLAFAPGIMRSHATDVITMGFPLALGVIVVTILIVAFYVSRANGAFDRLRARVVAETGR